MNDTESAAVRAATDYFDAWNARDLERLSATLTEDVVLDAPSGRLAGRDAVLGFYEGFFAMLTGSTMIASFGDDEHAVLFYDTHTRPVPNAASAEHVTVRDGLVAASTLVFDRAAFQAAQSS